MVSIIIVTHGEFGAYLIEAAESIVGVQHEGLKNISISPRMSLEHVKSAVADAIAQVRSEDGLIFMLDMPGGTPMNIVLPLAKDIAKSAVICGVNINMLTSAFLLPERPWFYRALRQDHGRRQKGNLRGQKSSS